MAVDTAAPLSTRVPARAISHRLALSCTVIFLAQLPLLLIYASQLWHMPQYQFFPLAILGAWVLARRQLSVSVDLRPGLAWLCATLLGISWSLLACSLLLFSAKLAAAAALLLSVTLAYRAGSGNLVRRLVPTWLLLGLTIPPPLGWDQRLVHFLQYWTSRCSSSILDGLDVLHTLKGNMIRTSDRSFLVEEACSGIQSLFAILACILFFTFWSQRGKLHSLLMLMSASGWVFLANILRVTLLVYAASSWNLDLSEGWRHTLLGMGIFSATLFLLASTDRLLLFAERVFQATVERPIKSSAHENKRDEVIPIQDGVHQHNRQVRLDLAPLMSRQALLAYGLLGLVQWIILGSDLISMAAAVEVPNPGELNEQTFPARLDAWNRVRYEAKHRNNEDPSNEYANSAKHSHTWYYRHGLQEIAIDLHYPVLSWREVANCYRGYGWVVVGRRTDMANDRSDLAEVEMHEMHDSRATLLLFGEFDCTGVPIRDPSSRGLLAEAASRLLSDNVFARKRRGQTERPCYLFQLLHQTHGSITEATRMEDRALMRQVEDILRRVCTHAEHAN